LKPPASAALPPPDPVAALDRIIVELRELRRSLKIRPALSPARTHTWKQPHLSLLRDPTPAELAAREERFRTYQIKILEFGKRAGERSPNTIAFFAARSKLSVSEISRWLPSVRPGRTREVKVGSATDLNIRAALDREILRLEKTLANFQGEVPISTPPSPCSA
jgi:hypothetical protein